jgi:Flp pilus assembly protein TadG
VKRGSRGDSGAASVEFALCLFILVPMAIGLIDAGLAMRLQIQLNSAAREGASFAQNHPSAVESTGACSTTDGIAHSITDTVADEEPGLSDKGGFTVDVVAPNATITGCNTQQVASGQTVEVRVGIDYHPPINLFFGNIHLSGSRTVVVQ